MKTNTTNAINDAIEPLRAAAIARNVAMVKAEIAKLINDNPIGTEITAKYPRPNGNMSKRDYRTLQATLSFVKSVLMTKPESHFWKAKEHVIGTNEKGIAHLIECATREASAAFDAYVAKLTSKVGDCDHATVRGDLWQGSTLTVTKGATIEMWKTQQIINVSCLGKVFNQWPTRLAK